MDSLNASKIAPESLCCSKRCFKFPGLLFLGDRNPQEGRQIFATKWLRTTLSCATVVPHFIWCHMLHSYKHYITIFAIAGNKNGMGQKNFSRCWEKWSGNKTMFWVPWFVEPSSLSQTLKSHHSHITVVNCLKKTQPDSGSANLIQKYCWLKVIWRDPGSVIGWRSLDWNWPNKAYDSSPIPCYRPSLKHQRPQEEKQKTFSAIGEWYKRGVDEGKKATKFRNGACENCGSMTHKKKDCMEVGTVDRSTII